MRSRLVAILLLISLAFPAALAATINVPGDQPTIQGAVDAAGNGDTIMVDAGTYVESVTVSEGVSIVGAGQSTVIRPLAGTFAFKITAANATLRNLRTDTAAGQNGTTNISIMVQESGASIVNNTIITTGDTALGVWVCGSDSGCAAPASNLTLLNNTIIINGVSTGFYAEFSTLGARGYTISHNNITANKGVALELYDVDDSLIAGNFFHGDDSGVNAAVIIHGQRRPVDGINFSDNRVLHGFHSRFGRAGTPNMTGINIIGNTFQNWTTRGMIIDSSVSGASVFNNIFSGSGENARDNGIGNQWNSSIGGNSWADFASNANYPYSYLVPGSAGAVDYLPDVEAPSVTFYAPAAGWKKTNFTVNASASDNTGVQNVSYRLENATFASSWFALQQAEGFWTADHDITAVADGNYTLRINATDPTGNSNATVTAGIIAIDDTLPLADAGVNQTMSERSAATLNASGSADNFGIISYSWDFDASDGIQANASGAVVSATYLNNGTFVATLTVTDAAGNTGTDTSSITVLDLGPTANFTFLPINPAEDQLISFTDISTTPGDSITAYNWTFGDGNSSSLQNATHRYAKNGTYTASLMVTDSDGSASAMQRQINISFIDDAPVRIGTIPAQSMQEDIPLALNLSLFFLDEESKLSYTVSGLANITAQTGNDILTLTPAAQFSGTVNGVFITAFDGVNDPVISNTFSITVSPVNDAPMISIPNQTITEDSGNTTLNITAFTTDVDTFNLSAFTYSATPANSSRLVCGTSGSVLWFFPQLNFFGNTSCLVSAHDGSNTTTVTLPIAVTNVNDIPVITSTPKTTATEDMLFTDTITAADADGNTLSYSINHTAIGINSATGALFWIPGNADVGTHHVLATVSDGTATATQSYTLTVINANDAPTAPVLVHPQSGAVIVSNSTTLRWNASQDIDGDTLFYLVRLSTNASSIPVITGISGLEHTVAVEHGKTYYWQIEAMDANTSTLSGSRSFTVSLKNPPTINFSSPAADPTVAEGASQTFTITAADVDAGDILAFSWLLDGRTISGATGNSLSFTPNFTQSGTHAITGVVTDSFGLNASRQWAVTVNHTNVAPVLAAIGPKSGNEDSALEFTILASDADGDTLSYASSDPRLAATKINNSAALVRWAAPGNADVGSHPLTLTVSDGLLTDQEAITVTIANTNDDPVIAGFSPALNPALPLGGTQLFNVTAIDIDPGVTAFSYTWRVDGNVQGGNSPVFSYTAPGSTGVHNVNVTVSDGSGGLASRAWSIDVRTTPKSAAYGGSTTNFAALPDPSQAQQVKIDNSSAGLIAFSGTLDLRQSIDIDNHVVVTKNLIAIDTTALPGFGSQAATITLRGLPYGKSPLIRREPGFVRDPAAITGICPDSICSNVQYDAATGTLSFAITGFSSYTTSTNTTNTPPRIVSAPVTSAFDNVQYQYGVSATDPENDALTYTLPTAPSGMSISAGGSITWNPGRGAIGVHPVTVRVADNSSAADTQSFNITVSEGPRLVLEQMDVTVDSKKDSNVQDRRRVSREAQPGSSVTVKARVRNTFTDAERLEIRSVIVTGTLIGIDDGDDIEEESSDFDLRQGQSKSVTLRFAVPGIADEDTYELLLEIEGDDENGTQHFLQRTVLLEVEKESHDLRLRPGLTRPLLSCVRNTVLQAEVVNFGQDDEDEVTLEISSSELGISIRETGISLSSDLADASSRYRKDVPITIADNRSGTYPIMLKAYYSDDNLDDTATAELQVEPCVTVEQPLRQQNGLEVVRVQPTAQLPARTTIAFTDTPEYLALLAGAVVILAAVVLVLVVVMVRRR